MDDKRNYKITSCMLGKTRKCFEPCKTCGWNVKESKRRKIRIRDGYTVLDEQGLQTLPVFKAVPKKCETGIVLRTYIDQNKITRGEFCKIFRFGKSAVSNWISGENFPSRESVEKIRSMAPDFGEELESAIEIDMERKRALKNRT